MKLVFSVEYDGLEMNLFQEISRYLNFTWSLVHLPRPGGYGTKLSNGTIVGGISQVLREGAADVAFCNIWQRDLAFQDMDFGPPLEQIFVTFIVRRPYQLGRRWQSLIGIFMNEVWLATSITLVTVSVVFWAGRSLASHAESRPTLIFNKNFEIERVASTSREKANPGAE
ncbi:hypothetical protein J6590_051222 [Homalodisca vitripennis]|nr:hypothetical protein J6590_051222 [Homalodisca vitripennis]